jgi:hypothetical protein
MSHSKAALLVVLTAALAAVSAMACGGSSAAPTTPTVGAESAASLAGNWTGTGADSQGGTVVTFALTQAGTSVSGTVKTQAVNPSDGSCSSCHRNKTGTFTGTVSGATTTWTMFFAAGANGDPTPACMATLTGATTTVAAASLTATYSGSDSCEGAFTNGTFSMTRVP